MTENKMLVDTSAWIVSFKKSGPTKLKKLLKEALDQNTAVTTPYVMMELLQGCRNRKEFSELKARLDSLERCDLDPAEWDSVYPFGYALRKKGLTVPTLDILLAFLAIENGYTLVHHDRHFNMIAKKSDLVTIDFLSP